MPSPRAARSTRQAWRDPRLAVGIVLVSLSVLLGATLLAGADDRVAVLAAGKHLAAGERLDRSALTTVHVGFASPEAADRYLPADADVAEGAVLRRPVTAGELLPRAALDLETEAALLELPLTVESTRVPSSVAAGSTVDVWAAPGRDGVTSGAEGAARRLLTAAPVLSASRRASTSLGLTQVVVGVPDDRVEISAVVRRLDPSTLLIVGRSGG